MATPLATAFVRLKPDFTGFKSTADKGIQDGTKGSGEKAGTKEGNSFSNAFAKVAKNRILSILGPALLALPAATTLAGVASGAVLGIGLAFGTAAVAAGTYGLVAKSVLSQASTASKAVQKAQSNYNIAIAAGTKQSVAYKAEQIAIGKAYANMSPAQIRLSKELGALSNQWQKVRASVTPLIAGSLQPWLVGVREAMSNLRSVISPMAPVVKDLGAQFAILMGSSTMQAFIRWIGATGSAVTHSIGGAILNVLTAMTFILPQFTPLINGASAGITKWSVAFVRWSASQKAADQIHAFLAWFHQNGPIVRQLLVNIGGALKALAPGLTTGAAVELKALSAFFGFIARLPPNIAKPLALIAGSLLVLNKLGVVKVGLQILGLSGAATATAGAAAGSGLWAKALPGVRLIGGALVAAVVVSMVLKSTSSGPGGKNWWDNPGGADPKSKDPSKQGISTWVGLGHQIEHIWDLVWQHTAGATIRGVAQITVKFGNLLVSSGTIFSRIRHDIVHYWDLIWKDSGTRVTRITGDAAAKFDNFRHRTAVVFDGMRHDIAHFWDLIWNNSIGRIQRGISDTVSWFHGLPGRILGALGNTRNLLKNQGKNVIQGFWDGLTAVWRSVTSWISGLAKWIKDHKGPVAFDRQLLQPAGHALMEGLSVGLLGGFTKVSDIVSGIAGNIANNFQGLLSGAVNIGKGFWHTLFGGGSGNVDQWTGVVKTALALLGEPLSLANQVLYQIGTESGGNPRAINLTDVNAQRGDPSRGLLQVIGGTFRAYGAPFLSHDIYDPLANVFAGINYAIHAYGRNLMSGGFGLGSGHGYALGGLITEPIVGVGRSGQRYTFGEKGEETVIPGDVGGKLDAIASLLAQHTSLLADLIGHTAAAPAATGHATAAALAGPARAGAYQSYYGVN
jgi:SLT domain-containing protein